MGSVDIEHNGSLQRQMSIASMTARLDPAKYITAQEASSWSKARRVVAVVVRSGLFEAAMGFVVFVNIIIMIMEADGVGSCALESQDCTSNWTDIANVVFLSVYLVELAIKVYAQGWEFRKSYWNFLDAAVVITGTTDVIITFAGVNAKGYGLSYIRLFRIARILRAIRLFRAFPELYKLVKGFAGTMKAIFWGAVMIVCVLTMWALVIVQYVQPFAAQLPADTDPWCLEAYSSVARCVVLLFQTVITGDNWGTCSIPIIVRRPEAFFLFAGAFITVQTGFVNLILAVIVDAAAASREEDSIAKLEKKKKAQAESIKKLYKLMEQLDSDNSGSVSLDELLEGYDADPKIQAMFSAMKIERSDLEMLFEYLVKEDGDDLSYAELVTALRRASEQDTKVQLMVLKLQMDKMAFVVASIVRTLHESRSGFKRANASIALNAEEKIASEGKEFLDLTSVLKKHPEASNFNLSCSRKDAFIASAEIRDKAVEGVVAGLEADLKHFREDTERHFSKLLQTTTEQLAFMSSAGKFLYSSGAEIESSIHKALVRADSKDGKTRENLNVGENEPDALEKKNGLLTTSGATVANSTLQGNGGCSVLALRAPQQCSNDPCAGEQCVKNFSVNV